MLKVKITSAEYAALPDALKTEYKLNSDGSYNVDLGPNAFITDKDPTALFNALESERAELKRVKEIADRFEAEKKQAEDEKKKAETEGITTIEQLKKFYQDEFAKRDAEAKQREAEREEQVKKQQVALAEAAANEKSQSIASSLFGSNAALMLPHVKSRLVAKVDANGLPTVEIIDPASGNALPDQNLDNFKRTLSTEPLFKDMVVISKASGGSANGGSSQGMPSLTTAEGKPKSYSDYKPAELLVIKKTDPALFTSLQSQK